MCCISSAQAVCHKLCRRARVQSPVSLESASAAIPAAHVHRCRPAPGESAQKIVKLEAFLALVLCSASGPSPATAQTFSCTCSGKSAMLLQAPLRQLRPLPSTPCRICGSRKAVLVRAATTVPQEVAPDAPLRFRRTLWQRLLLSLQLMPGSSTACWSGGN